MYKFGLTAVLSALLIITLFLSSCTAQESGLAQDATDTNDNTEETEKQKTVTILLSLL